MTGTVDWSLEPMSFENLELPCIFVPEGGKLPASPWADPAIFPAIFVPDGYQGPRPGYPWIEFGRLTLSGGKAGGPPAAVSVPTTAGTRQSNSTSDAEPRAVALDQFAAGPLAPVSGNSDGTRRATNGYPDLGATVRSWDSLPDLRATMAALDALSPSSPAARALPYPLPPVFLPGTPQNEELVWSLIQLGQAIKDAISNIVLNEKPNEQDNGTPSPGNLKPASTDELRAAAEADGYTSIETWKQQELQLDSRSNIVKDPEGNLYSVPTRGRGKPQALDVKLPR